MFATRIFTMLNPVFVAAFIYFWLETIGHLHAPEEALPQGQAMLGMFSFFALIMINGFLHVMDEIDLPYYSEAPLILGLAAVGLFTGIYAPAHLFFASVNGLTTSFVAAGSIWLILAVSLIGIKISQA